MKRMAVCTVISLAIALSAAAAKPDFTGEWKMVPSKSDFGPMPAPQSFTSKIEHKDPDLVVNNTQVGNQGEMKTQSKYKTDGSESTNEVRGNPVKSVVKWDGDSLKFDSKLKIQDMDISIADKWTMAEDGKSFTSNRHFESPQGAADLKIVFEKQ